MSLFDDVGMRKTSECAIYNCFETANIDKSNMNVRHISLIEDICYTKLCGILVKYDQYVRRHFCLRVTAVFYGYSDYTKNIKAIEQLCQTTTMYIFIFGRFFYHLMTVPTSQQKCLPNANNKTRLI